MKFANGNIHEGNYKDDKKNGHGVYKFANAPNKGDVYEGNFKDDERDGHGVHKFADGRVLDGQWKDGKFLG